MKIKPLEWFIKNYPDENQRDKAIIDYIGPLIDSGQKDLDINSIAKLLNYSLDYVQKKTGIDLREFNPDYVQKYSNK